MFDTYIYLTMDKKNKYILLKCIKFAKDKLKVTTQFTLKPCETREELKTYAYYDPANHILAVYVKNRGLADICRSFIHELVHHKQNEEGRVEKKNQDIGGEIEDEANSKAGSIIKEFSYKLLNEEKIDIYEL